MTEAGANTPSGVAADTAVSVTAPVDAAPVAQSTPTPAAETISSASAPSAAVEAVSPASNAEAATVATPTETKSTDTSLSLLNQDEPKKEGDPAPAEEKLAEGADKPEGQSDEPAPLPTYEAFKFPDDVTVDNDRLSDFTKSLAEFENNSKASHEEVQKLGQSLVDRHVEEVRNALTRQMDGIVKQWNDKKAEWVNEFKNDPDLGGKRYETSISEAKEFIRTHGGTPEQINSFYQALKDTGMEAHPAMIRFLINVKNSSGFRAPQQLPAQKPPTVTSKVAKRYGSSS